MKLETAFNLAFTAYMCKFDENISRVKAYRVVDAMTYNDSKRPWKFFVAEWKTND